jgi:twitching motility protein PilT
MLGTDAVLNLIRENKGHQLNSTIQTGTKLGMTLLDNSLATLVRSGTIKLEAALEKVHNRAEFMAEVQRM